MHSQRDWDQFVLLLVDLQRGCWTENIAKAFPKLPTNMKKLLKLCRSEGIDLVHVRIRFKADRSDWMPVYLMGREPRWVEGTAGEQVLPFAQELTGEKVFWKNRYDAFTNRDLRDCLRESGKRFVLTAGLVTSVCVLLTSVAATQQGYLVAVVEDCCADTTRAHENTLSNYGFMFDWVCLDQVINRYTGWLKDIEVVYKDSVGM